MLDYRQLSSTCEIIGPGLGQPNSALLPVSHNRTGKVYLAVVALRDIQAGQEITIDRGAVSYAHCMGALLQAGIRRQQQEWQQRGEDEHDQAELQQGLAGHSAGSGKGVVPAGKLHKSLMNQMLAALATCRKLPSGEGTCVCVCTCRGEWGAAIGSELKCKPPINNSQSWYCVRVGILPVRYWRRQDLASPAAHSKQALRSRGCNWQACTQPITAHRLSTLYG